MTLPFRILTIISVVFMYFTPSIGIAEDVYKYAIATCYKNFSGNTQAVKGSFLMTPNGVACIPEEYFVNDLSSTIIPGGEFKKSITIGKLIRDFGNKILTLESEIAKLKLDNQSLQSQIGSKASANFVEQALSKNLGKIDELPILIADNPSILNALSEKVADRLLADPKFKIK